MGFLSRCPNVQAASGLPEETVARWLAIEQALEDAATEFAVPVGLLTAIAYVESRFRAEAVSATGAAGIMQLMPGTLRFLLGKHGLKWSAFDPLADATRNIRVGAYYLSRLLRRWKGRPVDWAIASYFAGAGAVGQYGPSRWGDYVDKVRLARDAVGLTFARCAGAPWADKPPHWPGLRKPSSGAGPKPKREDEVPGSGGARPEHLPRSELGGAATVALGVIGGLIAFRERRTRNG